MEFQKFIATHGKPVSMAKGEHLFRQGDVDANLYFIKTGLLKAYYVSDEGKEFVKSFLQPDSSIASVSCFLSDTPSTFSTISLEPTTLVMVPFNKLYEASTNEQAVAMKMIDMLLQLAMKKERREYEFLCLSAEERYRQVIANSPLLLEKITQGDLAKYLGVTPIGLSRIKKRVSKN